MPTAAVEPVLDDDGSAAYGAVGGLHETNTPRDLNLVIEPAGERFHLSIQTADPDLQAAFGDDLEHELPLTRDDLWGHVQICRQAWRTAVVDHRRGGGLPFQDRWDHAADPALLAAALPEIARAGSKLFIAIFHPFLPDHSAAVERLQRIGKVLREKMNQHPRWLRVTSDSFFAPWSLIYSDPLDVDGTDARPEGFWGYRHLIEHVTSEGSLGYELVVPDGKVEVGFQVDDRIDRVLGVPCLGPVVDQLDRYRDDALVVHPRTTKRQLAKSMRPPPPDQVLFFCCHAVQEGDFTGFRIDESYLKLSEQPADRPEHRITPGDIGQWMDLDVFPHHPLVFLNACGSGQLNSIFYAGFGRTFLGRRASGVVGAQTELPAIFAGEFARRFFATFFEGGTQRSVGRVLYDLRRRFLDDHNNPLGLIYSLYRGADCHLPGPVAER